MLSPHRRIRRVNSAGRGVILLLALTTVACSSTLEGSPEVGSGSGTASSASSGSTTAGSSGSSTPDTDQITVPSTAGGSSSSTSAPRSSPVASSSASSSSSGTATGAPTADLAKFYDQTLNWQNDCASYSDSSDDLSFYKYAGLQCARLTVPLSYSDPTGPTITIGVLKQAVTGGGSKVGSVVFDPGGPGVSGMSIVAQIAAAKLAPVLTKNFDLVGIDPRGVGSSQPSVMCRTDAEWDAERAMASRSQTAAEVAAYNALQKTIADDCVTRTGVAQGIDGKTFLANIGTQNVARDLDVLRAALGDSKLTYVGWSYGTQIGYTYAEEFPTNVRAMILDGVVDPDEDPTAADVGQAKGFQNAFDAFATWCAAQAGCPVGSDPSQATAVFQSLTRPLLGKPISLVDGRVLSYEDAISGVTFALYYDYLRPALSKAITALQAGNGAPLMVLADEYYARDSSGHYSPEQDAFNAVRCVDNPRITDPAQITKLNQELTAAAPYEDDGDPVAAEDDICAVWPVPVTGTVHKLNIPNLSAKVLVISTTGDPATPYQNGVNVANELHAALLTVNGTRHTAYLLQEIPCADTIGNAYLENLTTPTAGTTCS